MLRYQLIQYCPRCGQKYAVDAFDAVEVCYRCTRCSFAFYQNSVPSTSILIPAKHSPAQILLMARATEPCLNKLALPGGFLAYGEVPEEGARREAEEETLLTVTIDRLLTTYLLDYYYAGAQISVLELAFLALPVDGVPDDIHTAEASHLAFYNASWIKDHADMLAFPEQVGSVNAYVQMLSCV
jgi:ADP-ribose pyrophosphatase YjhB (NUDIX family)